MNASRVTAPGPLVDAFSRLGFLKKKAKLILSWPIVALIVAGIGWTALADHLAADRQEASANALSNVAGLVSSYADNVERTCELIDQIASHVRFEWKLAQRTLRLEDMRANDSLLLPQFLYIAIIDRDGVPQTSTIAYPSGISLADRQVFLAQKTAASDFLYMGPPVTGALSGKTVIQFSRRLVDDEGNFSGIVLVAVSPDYFTASYDTAILGTHGLLEIIGQDGTVFAARIGDAANRGLSTQEPFSAPGFPTQAGSFVLSGAEWFSDRRDRFVGWRAIGDYPIIAMVGLDEREALAPYRAYYVSSIRAAGLAGAGLLVFTMIAIGLSVRLAWRKHKLEIAQKTYQIARESGTEALFIVRPIRDAQREITDFELVDCNQRGADFLLWRRAEVIGKTMHALYGGRTLACVMEMLREAMETNGFQRDIQIPSESPVAPQWVHLKAMRHGDEIAITAQDIGAAKTQINELERQSNEDTLTGLPNRLWVQKYLPSAIERAEVNRSMLAVLFLDLDGFKAVNDTMGHPAGDELLQNAARRLKVAVRPHDHVARLAGDEFVVIIEDVRGRADVEHVAQRITHSFKENFRLSAGAASVGTSIGISVFPFAGADADTLMKNADVALYAVKASGKGAYRFFDQNLDRALQTRREKEDELRYALEHDQLVLHYQPRIDIATGRVSSLEALVRWAHPTKGLLTPAEFVDLAEQTGLIARLGELVIDKVCAQIAHWANSGKEPLPISVNISLNQFDEGNIVNVISAALSRHNVNPRMLEFEIKESSLMREGGIVCETLAAIHRMGIKLMVDDFGTGYSSLSRFQQLDVGALKIDQVFTAKLEKAEEGNAFFSATIAMAHALGMRVVAEGVENERQIQILKALECDEIQGFYISAPSPMEEAGV